MTEKYGGVCEFCLFTVVFDVDSPTLCENLCNPWGRRFSDICCKFVCGRCLPAGPESHTHTHSHTQHTSTLHKYVCHTGKICMTITLKKYGSCATVFKASQEFAWINVAKNSIFGAFWFEQVIFCGRVIRSRFEKSRFDIFSYFESHRLTIYTPQINFLSWPVFQEVSVNDGHGSSPVIIARIGNRIDSDIDMYEAVMVCFWCFSPS